MDGDIGQVTDFLFDDPLWTIRYLITDASGFWERPIQVLIAPHWAQKINWAESMIYLDLTRDTIASSPTWSPETELSREFEDSLHEYFDRPRYWVDGDGKEERSGRGSLGASSS